MRKYLGKLDPTFINLLNDIENNIRTKNTNTIVSIQIFTESLLKWINKRERIIFQQKASLGDFIYEDEFINFLETKLVIDTTNIIKINRLGNRHKHDNVHLFDVKSLKGFYFFILNASNNVYNYYGKKNVNFEINKQNFDLLMTEYDDKIQELEEGYLKELQSKEDEIQEILIRLKEAQKNEEVINRELKKTSILETEINHANIKISKLMKERESLIKQNHDETSILRKEQDKLINELRLENKLRLEEINEIKSKNIKSISELKEKYEILLEEKTEEKTELSVQKQENISVLKNSLANINKSNKNNFLNRFALMFSSSYLDNNKNFIVRNINVFQESRSKYKSFYAVLFNLLQRGNTIYKSEKLNKLNLDDLDYHTIYKLQMAILSLIKTSVLNDSTWKINYIGGDLQLLRIAIDDIFDWLITLTNLAGIKYVKPKMFLTSTVQQDNVINIVEEELEGKNVFNILEMQYFKEKLNLWIESSIKYRPTNSKDYLLKKLLFDIFRHEDFLGGQIEILKHNLAGNDTIGILPTGGGKSLTYQFTALLQPKISLVVAPLNSLIKDQIDGLFNKYNITKCINLTSGNENMYEDLNRLKEKQAIFVFVSPERFQSLKFRNILINISDRNLFHQIVLDEVHCLSEWGHDFRISYLMLAHTINSLFSHVKYLGLTATASPNVVNDLIAELNMRKNRDVIFSKKYKRDNLLFHFKKIPSITEFYPTLIELLEKTNPGSNGGVSNAALVFSKTVGSESGSLPSVKKIAHQLSFEDKYKDMVTYYHGKSLSIKEKEKNHDSFMKDEKSIMVATKAFGMGIDKPNIRTTVHMGIPDTFEAFYQEAGRAGRDGTKSNCYLLSQEPSREFKNNLIEFLNVNTPPKRLIEIINDPYWDDDLYLNFLFMSSHLKDPEEEARNTFELYKALVKTSKKKIVMQDDEKWTHEKHLYILNKLGIVDNWTKHWGVLLGDGINTYTISLSNNYDNVDHIQIKAAEYLSKYYRSDIYIEEINKVTKIEDLETIIRSIRVWYYETFINNKRNQLAAMYEKFNQFANIDASKDIQTEFDTYFDLTNILDKTSDGYSLTFEEDSIDLVVLYAANLVRGSFNSRKNEMIQLFNSGYSNNNMNIYISLIHLIENTFDSVYGENRFDFAFKNIKSNEEKENLYESLAKYIYPILNKEAKYILLSKTFELDDYLFRNNLLENTMLDKTSMMYWLYYANKKFKEIL